MWLISVADIGLPCQVQSLASFQALHPCACSILKMFRTQREVPDFYRLFSKFTIKKKFDSPSFYQTLCLRYLPQPSALVDNSYLGIDTS